MYNTASMQPDYANGEFLLHTGVGYQIVTYRTLVRLSLKNEQVTDIRAITVRAGTGWYSGTVRMTPRHTATWKHERIVVV